MIAISDRTRSTLYVLSAAMLVVWSIGEVSIAQSNAAEAPLLPDLRGVGASTPDRALTAQPTTAPVTRDPFAGSFATPAPSPTAVPVADARPNDGGYEVPNIGQGGLEKSHHVVLEGIVTGGAQASASAIVLSDADTRLVHVGDQIGAWTISAIDTSGITFANGRRLTMEMSPFK